jgi:TolA-binding protein
MRILVWGLGGWLILSAAPVAVFSADSTLIYKPQPAEAGAAPAGPEEGILVRGITIRKGDTLKGLARKYRGRASYFPQILLFNRIANPDLILTGAKLLVPVTAAPPKAHKVKARPVPPPTDETAAKAISPQPRPVSKGADPSLLQYQRAVAAYKKGQLGRALEEFDRFLADFPGSPLAADAALYRADCLLNLSRQ